MTTEQQPSETPLTDSFREGHRACWIPDEVLESHANLERALRKAKAELEAQRPDRHNQNCLCLCCRETTPAYLVILEALQ